MESSHQYSYDALVASSQSIRLVTVLPDRETESVRCQIETFQLASAPPYTGLSYTWGKANPSCTIKLNEQSLVVTPNLKAFVSQVASSTRLCNSRYWIDALCIDQSNMVERRHQVGLMSEIFRTARDVVAWLGCSHSGSDIAIQTMRTPYRREIWSSLRGNYIRALCQRDYWTRLWVV